MSIVQQSRGFFFFFFLNIKIKTNTPSRWILSQSEQSSADPAVLGLGAVLLGLHGASQGHAPGHKGRGDLCATWGAVLMTSDKRPVRTPKTRVAAFRVLFQPGIQAAEVFLSDSARRQGTADAEINVVFVCCECRFSKGSFFFLSPKRTPHPPNPTPLRIFF